MLQRKQSAELTEVFKKQVTDKVSANRNHFQEQIKNESLIEVGTFFWDVVQKRNEFLGNIGENITSVFSKFMPDTWVMFKNALIPVNSSKLTEIDILLVGPQGVFLLEVKSWKGSFACYKDKWKRREGSKWLPLDNSPSQQSLYHQQVFHEWINKSRVKLATQDIISPVIFPLAKWVGVNECSVPVIQCFLGLEDFFLNRQIVLNVEQVLQITEMIEDIKMPTNQPSMPPNPKPKPILRKHSPTVD